MLQVSHTDYLARQERFNDMVKAAEKERLIQELTNTDPDTQHKLAGWLGEKLVTLGEKLEDYGNPPAPVGNN